MKNKDESIFLNQLKDSNICNTKGFSIITPIF